MISVKMLDVLKNEGVVAIVSQGKNGPHVVNTWNSYIKITEDKRIIAPVGGMKVTESNIQENNNILMTIGSREVEGFHSMGTGFLITASASFAHEGSDYEHMKQSFPWARAIIVITPETITQTL